MRNIFYFICLLILFSMRSETVFSSEREADSKSRMEIINRLKKWPKDFNAKNVEDVCGLFAPDLLARHVGVPDQNYEELCQDLRQVLTSSNKTYVYEPPKIEQIFVDGDLAAVSVIWTLKISSENGSKTEIDKAKSLDIFKRQSDGSWKIVTFYSFTTDD